MTLEQFLVEPPQQPQIRPSLWADYERLQARLAEERDMRRGRSLALTTMDEAIRGMSADLDDERRLFAEAEDARIAHCRRLDAVEVTLEELQEEHSRLKSYCESLEPERRRLGDAAA